MKIAFLFLLTSLVSCEFTFKSQVPVLPLAQRVTWENKAPVRYWVDSSGLGDARPSEGTQEPRPIRDHHFAFAGIDTIYLTLHEYRRDYSAYAAFSSRASASEMGDGFYRSKNSLVFFHRAFLGEIQYAHAGLMPEHFLSESLVFRDEDLFQPPEIFKSFPLKGRLSNTDRIQMDHFLGRQWHAPVFSVQYRCHSDTATAFRMLGQGKEVLLSAKNDWSGKADTSNWGRDIHFFGQDEYRIPLQLWVFREGLLGISGCYDSSLALEYVEKMEKMTVLLQDP